MMVLGLVSEKETQTLSMLGGGHSWQLAIRAKRGLLCGEAVGECLSLGLYTPDLTHMCVYSIPYLHPMLIR